MSLNFLIRGKAFTQMAKFYMTETFRFTLIMH